MAEITEPCGHLWKIAENFGEKCKYCGMYVPMADDAVILQIAHHLERNPLLRLTEGECRSLREISQRIQRLAGDAKTANKIAEASKAQNERLVAEIGRLKARIAELERDQRLIHGGQ